ncbi:MAG: CBS domain-containing protein [Thaumarchaeota archaeon]|nr:CBS domain-containing protein [Nitrososphaerota archaeon]
MPEKTADLWWLFTRQTVCTTQNESVLNAAILMLRRNFRHLPVITESGRRLVGVLSAQDIIDSVSLALGPKTDSQQVLESLDIPIHRIMSLHPIVIEKGDGLEEAAKKMITHNIGALPVVDDFGQVQGIITLRDLVGLLGTGSEPLGVKVSEIMTREVTKINSESTVADAVHLMAETRVRRLPIVSRNTSIPLGMLTNKDVLRLLARIKNASGGEFGEGENGSIQDFRTKISEIMARDVIAVEVDDDIRTAASRIMIFGIGGLAVQSPETPGQIQGLVTERDLIKRLSSVRSVNFLVESMKFELEVQERSSN